MLKYCTDDHLKANTVDLCGLYSLVKSEGCVQSIDSTSKQHSDNKIASSRDWTFWLICWCKRSKYEPSGLTQSPGQGTVLTLYKTEVRLMLSWIRNARKARNLLNLWYVLCNCIYDRWFVMCLIVGFFFKFLYYKSSRIYIFQAWVAPTVPLVQFILLRVTTADCPIRILLSFGTGSFMPPALSYTTFSDLPGSWTVCRQWFST